LIVPICRHSILLNYAWQYRQWLLTQLLTLCHHLPQVTVDILHYDCSEANKWIMLHISDYSASSHLQHSLTLYYQRVQLDLDSMQSVDTARTMVTYPGIAFGGKPFTQDFMKLYEDILETNTKMLIQYAISPNSVVGCESLWKLRLFLLWFWLDQSTLPQYLFESGLTRLTGELQMVQTQLNYYHSHNNNNNTSTFYRHIELIVSHLAHISFKLQRQEQLNVLNEERRTEICQLRQRILQFVENQRLSSHASALVKLLCKDFTKS